MKKIGIVPNEIRVKDGPLMGSERVYINRDYVEIIVKAGAIPVILPMTYNKKVIEELIKDMDGIIISGGDDINPLCYGESPLPLLGDVNDERDILDLLVIEVSIEKNKPILGICRGCQILNVAFGGTLYQDVSYKSGIHFNHLQKNFRENGSHEISVEKNSFLYEVLGAKYIVNSFHHDGIKDLAKEFKIVAMAYDGVIEAIESQGDLFIAGVQWHPEMMHEKKEMVDLIKKFIEKLN